MRVFGTPQPVDLISKDSPTLVPGSSKQSCTFKVDATVPIINGKYVLVIGYGGCVQTVFDQAASGGTAVNGDDLPRLISSVNVKSPVLGTTHDASFMSGPMLEHVWGWLANGYTGQRMRNQIASTDGDTTIQHYFRVPYTSELFESPHHFGLFLDWLKNTEIKFELATSTVFDSLSTGAVLKATTNVRMWLDTVVSSECYIPTVYEQEFYDATANGSNTHTLDNVGLSGKWNGLKTGGRIFAFWELTDQKGMGAADGADNITSYKVDLFGLDTVNIDALFENHRLVTGGHRGAISGNSTTIIHDGAANPEAITASPNGTLNTATAMYTPVKSPGRNTKLTKLMKFAGSIKATRGFTSAPSSGVHRWAVPLAREFDEGKKDELAVRAGFLPGDKNRATVGLTGKTLRKNQDDTLPQRLLRRAG